MMVLLKSPRRTRRRAGAYTLTEMLVVLVIVGLLAAVVGPRLFNRLDNAKQRTARLQITNLESAVDLFRLDVGRLPTEQEGLQALVEAPAAADAWLGPYLARAAVPLDPWGNAYAYVIDAADQRASILSYGADGREGGTGAAADVQSRSAERAPPAVSREVELREGAPSSPDSAAGAGLDADHSESGAEP